MNNGRVLVVVDMQNDFVDGSLGTPEAAAIVPGVAAEIRNFGGRVVYTLDTHSGDYLGSAEGKRLPVEHCIKGTAGWDLNPEVAMALEEAGAVGVEKATFGGSALPAEAARLGEPAEIELVGLCTDVCVISNALLLKAFFPEADIWINGSLTEGVTREGKQTALKALAPCQIDVRWGAEK